MAQSHILHVAQPIVGQANACASGRGQRVVLLEAEEQGKSRKRFAGEWLHPQGVDALKKLGFDAITAMQGRPQGRGFVVYPGHGESPVKLDYVEGQRGLAFHHGDLVDERYQTTWTFSFGYGWWY